MGGEGARQLDKQGRETIAIMDEERKGFDEMEALASLFWRRSRHTNSKIDTRQHFGLRKQVSMSFHRLPSHAQTSSAVVFLSPSLLLRLTPVHVRRRWLGGRRGASAAPRR
jgi:hypothetical protein